jgi:hypothetical protein
MLRPQRGFVSNHSMDARRARRSPTMKTGRRVEMAGRRLIGDISERVATCVSWSAMVPKPDQGCPASSQDRPWANEELGDAMTGCRTPMTED